MSKWRSLKYMPTVYLLLCKSFLPCGPQIRQWDHHGSLSDPGPRKVDTLLHLLAQLQPLSASPVGAQRQRAVSCYLAVLCQFQKLCRQDINLPSCTPMSDKLPDWSLPEGSPMLSPDASGKYSLLHKFGPKPSAETNI